MRSYREFAKDALILVAVCTGVAATPLAAAAQSQDPGNAPVEVPYAGSGGPVNQQNLPPAAQNYAPPQNYAPQNYAPPRNEAPNYAPPAPPSAPPPAAYYRPSDQQYAAQGNRDYRADDPAANYGPAEDNRYDNGYRTAYAAQPPAPAPQRCQIVEQRAFFPDDTTQLTTVRACRDGHGRWRISD